MSSGKIVKPKSKYYSKPLRKKSSNMDVNYKGFLCSCNNREKDCIRESYQILNKAVDELYGSDSPEQKTEEIDISDEISKEIDALKSDKLNQKFKFNVCDSGAKNLIFIRTTLDDPAKISQHIVENIFQTKQQQTRFLLRLVPIEVTCKAYLKDIEKAFEPLAEKYFQNEGRTFSIVYNHRNNNSLSRDEVIKTIAEKVSSLNKDNKVNLKEADVSIVIEIIRGFAFVGVVPNFLKYKKYNLLALSDKVDNVDEEKTDLIKDETDNKDEEELDNGKEKCAEDSVSSS
ncbi:THUMP domain-containing protein 1 homolog [Coccinella septempunctata]|uniref:THUMP domain-containing protein 1 homolog n=1 Tax=Coccinella septempunctata TaxID=41139 RepID=UPI001D05E792|nr:THUMP domain-containing protein 1 homolog [Coccinella septempunctata]